MNLRDWVCAIFGHRLGGEIPLGMTVLKCDRCRYMCLVRRGWKPRVLR